MVMGYMDEYFDIIKRQQGAKISWQRCTAVWQGAEYHLGCKESRVLFIYIIYSFSLLKQ